MAAMAEQVGLSEGRLRTSPAPSRDIGAVCYCALGQYALAGPHQ